MILYKRFRGHEPSVDALVTEEWIELGSFFPTSLIGGRK
jgi:hypothetical protein